MRSFSITALFALLLSLSACTKSAKKELWVYTSVYQEVIEMMKPQMAKSLPDVTIQWFASGSEKVGAKINAEIEANNLQADILMTSDPFSYIDLKNKGLFVSYESPNAKNIPHDLNDADHYFATVRVPVMVMALNRNMLAADQAPKSFLELTEKKWKGKVTMGSPLESGTNFTTVATLSRKYGWDYFKKLRANDVMAAGGNSAVRQRLEGREFPVGILLLENILQAQSQGSPLDAIYPEDGVVLVPSPMAIFKRTKHLAEAQKLVDFFFSEQGQIAMVKGNMYSANPDIDSPKRARPFDQILKRSFAWNQEFAQAVLADHQKIKENFSRIMYE